MSQFSGRPDPSQGRSGAVVGARALCRRPAGADRNAARSRASARRTRTPRLPASMRAAALAQDGVWAVITGEDVRKLSDPFLIALKAPVNQWSLAVERVRYVGEPVALVVAESRYLAEDAADLVRIDYEPLAAVIDPQAARETSAPLLHAEAKTNEISVRKFSYGDTERAFEQAHARVALTCEYPRNSFTPMECYVVVAEYRPADESYDVLANFQGPFSTHPGDGARAARARPEAAPAHPARLRRQLRHQALGVSLYRAGRDRRPRHRPAGEMGRGPARASPRRQLRSEPHHRDRSRRRQGRPHPGAAARSARGLRRVPARADAGAALPHARRGHRRLRHRQCRRGQPRGAHQQDAGEPDPRLRRAAALSRARAAGAAHRRSSSSSTIST